MSSTKNSEISQKILSDSSKEGNFEILSSYLRGTKDIDVFLLNQALFNCLYNYNSSKSYYDCIIELLE